MFLLWKYVLGALFLTIASIATSDFLKWKHLPRGPLPIPFIGNILSLPKSKDWVKSSERRRKYGKFYTIWMYRRPILLVCDPEIAAELFEKGTNYASRPKLVVLTEVFGGKNHIVSMPHGKPWATRRKYLNLVLKPSSLPMYQPRQEAEAVKLVSHLLWDSNSLVSSLDRYTASIVFSMAYGRRVDRLDAKVVTTKLDFMAYVTRLTTPGIYLAESIPFLAKLPTFLAPWKAPIIEKGEEEKVFNESLIDLVYNDISKKGKSRSPCLVEMMLERGKDIECLTKLEQSYIPGTLFAAGADTTASALRTAILGLITHPSVLHAAKEEIDSVVGTSRSPTFSDELPYIEALVKEVLRWRPITPLNLPHTTSEDDTYKQYHIPKGTTVILNFWAMNLDATYFPDPQALHPERFLPSSDSRFDHSFIGKPFPSKFGQAGFSWGRRSCPGADLAIATMGIVLAKIIWAFEILKVEGEIYDTMNLICKGVIQRPAPFKCEFKLRSDEHGEALTRELVDAEQVLNEFLPFD